MPACVPHGAGMSSEWSAHGWARAGASRGWTPDARLRGRGVVGGEVTAHSCARAHSAQPRPRVPLRLVHAEQTARDARRSGTDQVRMLCACPRALKRSRERLTRPLLALMLVRTVEFRELPRVRAWARTMSPRRRRCTVGGVGGREPPHSSVSPRRAPPPAYTSARVVGAHERERARPRRRVGAPSLRRAAEPLRCACCRTRPTRARPAHRGACANLLQGREGCDGGVHALISFCLPGEADSRRFPRRCLPPPLHTSRCGGGCGGLPPPTHPCPRVRNWWHALSPLSPLGVPLRILVGRGRGRVRCAACCTALL